MGTMKVSYTNLDYGNSEGKLKNLYYGNSEGKLNKPILWEQ